MFASVTLSPRESPSGGSECTSAERFGLFRRGAGCRVGAPSAPGLPSRAVPVEGGVSPQRVDADVLFHQAVQKDREGGEADVVQSQVGGVVQSLRGAQNQPENRTPP